MGELRNGEWGNGKMEEWRGTSNAFLRFPLSPFLPFLVSLLLSSVFPYNAAALEGQSPQYIEVTGTLPGYPWVEISDFRGYTKEYCITCHNGIEQISKSHPMEWGCSICHLGNPESLDKEEAHMSLLYGEGSKTGKRNPSNLRVVELSCGQRLCHAGHTDERHNYIERVKMSAMSRPVGIITFIKYLFGESLPDGLIDEYMDNGGNEKKKFSDHLWSGSCSGCHLWDEGRWQYGEYRAQGCAACHVLYDKDGLYKGGDPTTPRDIPGYPRGHKLTISIPSQQCNICHKNSSTAISGVTFEGIDIDIKGRHTSVPGLQDIHRSKGMVCIDCHTIDDVMGDGRLHSKGIEQVEIKCRSCHGDYKNSIRIKEIQNREDPVIRLSQMSGTYSNRHGDTMLITEKGNKFSNVKIEGRSVVLFGKLSGRRHIVPQITGKNGAHAAEYHKRLKCSACHSLWVPQYYGGMDILEQTDLPKGLMKRDRFFAYKRLFYPSFGIDSFGKVSVFAPLYQLRFSARDGKGNLIAAMDKDEKVVDYYNNFIFKTTDGYSSALASVPVSPHSIQKRVRSCEDCHINPKAIGLGEGKSVPGTGGSLFPYDVTVTAQGDRVAPAGYTGARGFNKSEMNRIARVGLCIPCHDSYTDPVYQNIKKSYKEAKGERHKKIIVRYKK